MSLFPEKIITATRPKIRLPLAFLWIIIFPCFCFLLYLTHYEFSQGGSISYNVFILVMIVVFLLGITKLSYLIERQSLQPVTLTADGIKVIYDKQTKFIAWSEISHIEDTVVISLSGDKKWAVRLHLHDSQNMDDFFQRKNKWKKIWYNTGILNIPTYNLCVSHKELLNLVEAYFQNSKTSQ